MALLVLVAVLVLVPVLVFVAVAVAVVDVLASPCSAVPVLEAKELPS